MRRLDDVTTISVLMMGVKVPAQTLDWIKDPTQHERKYIHFCNGMQTANNNIDIWKIINTIQLVSLCVIFIVGVVITILGI